MVKHPCCRIGFNASGNQTVANCTLTATRQECEAFNPATDRWVPNEVQCSQNICMLPDLVVNAGVVSPGNAVNAQIYAGGTAVFSASVSNAGAASADSVVFTVSLPSPLKMVAGSLSAQGGPSCTFNASRTVLTCTKASMPVGDTVSITGTLELSASASPMPACLANMPMSATATTVDAEQRTDNNSAVQNFVVNCGVCCDVPKFGGTPVCTASNYMSQAECTSNPFLSGPWLAPPNTCGNCPKPAPKGACCSAGICLSDYAQVDCSGTWKGAGVACTPTLCSQPPETGTCCYVQRNVSTGKYERKTERVEPSNPNLWKPELCASVRNGVFNKDPIPFPLACPVLLDFDVDKEGPDLTLVQPGDDVSYTVSVTMASGTLPSGVSPRVLDGIPTGLVPKGLPVTAQQNGCSWLGSPSTFITCNGMGPFHLTFTVAPDHCPNTSISPNSAVVYPPAGYYDDNVTNNIALSAPLALACSSGQGVCCEYSTGRTEAKCVFPANPSTCNGTNREFKPNVMTCENPTAACPPRPVGTCCRNAANSCLHKVTKDVCYGLNDNWVEGDFSGRGCMEKSPPGCDLANPNCMPAVCDFEYRDTTTCCFPDPKQCKEEVSVTTCEALGGNPTNAASCAACPATGACCTVTPAFSCSESKDASSCKNGTLLPGKTCSSCIQSVGVCCGAKGQSQENMTKETCAAKTDFAPAQWFAGKDKAYCPLTGACCDPTSATGCSRLTRDACQKIPNATYQGDNTTCEDPGLACVKMGACCEAGKACKQTRRSQCLSPAVFSEGKTCQQACPIGTCCHPDAAKSATKSCGVNALKCEQLKGHFVLGGSCGSSD